MRYTKISYMYCKNWLAVALGANIMVEISAIAQRASLSSNRTLHAVSVSQFHRLRKTDSLEQEQTSASGRCFLHSGLCVS